MVSIRRVGYALDGAIAGFWAALSLPPDDDEDEDEDEEEAYPMDVTQALLWVGLIIGNVFAWATVINAYMK